MIWKQDGSIELWVEEVADEDGTYVREARRWSLDGRFRTRLRSLAVSLRSSGTLTLQKEIERCQCELGRRKRNE